MQIDISYLLNFFNYIYEYLARGKVLLDEFSFADSTIFNDFFGAIRYVLGDTIYMYLYIVVVCSICFLLFRLFKETWETFVS